MNHNRYPITDNRLPITGYRLSEKSVIDDRRSTIDDRLTQFISDLMKTELSRNSILDTVDAGDDVNDDNLRIAIRHVRKSCCCWAGRRKRGKGEERVEK